MEEAIEAPVPVEPGTTSDVPLVGPSVDGVIELERLENVLYVARPAYGQPESTIGLFKIDADGKTATRTSVKLGRASVSTIEVQQGLQQGDSVIVSDMQAHDNVNRVRIKR